MDGPPKVIGRLTYLSGMGCFLGMTPWKGAPVDAHGIEHLGVHDVEAAAPIHQYLGEPLWTDNWVDDKRIPSRVWDGIRMVGPVEGYGGFRPPEKGWRGRSGGIDLTTCDLLAAPGVVGH